jgi:hypothetical protein
VWHSCLLSFLPQARFLGAALSQRLISNQRTAHVASAAAAVVVLVAVFVVAVVVFFTTAVIYSTAAAVVFQLIATFPCALPVQLVRG